MRTVMTSSPKIVRIVDVRDTRQFEEINDKWVPIPGSGTERPCDRCGRTHEIHVDVELSDGTTANIGQGCARGESMQIQSRIKSAISAATTIAKLNRELAATKTKIADAEAAWRKVMARSLPQIVLEDELAGTHGTSRVYAMGDANVWTLPGRPFDAERKEALISSWRGNRYSEVRGAGAGKLWFPGASSEVNSLKNKVRDLTNRIRRAESKVIASKV